MKVPLQTCKDAMRNAVVDKRREDSTKMSIAKIACYLGGSHIAIGKFLGICFGGTKESYNRILVLML